MLDVIVPIHYEDASMAAHRSLPAMADIQRSFPMRFVIVGCGGSHDDWQPVRNFLDCLRDNEGLHYGLMVHEPRLTTEAGAVAAGTNHIKHDLVLISDPSVCITDTDFLQKLWSPLKVAPYVGGVWIAGSPMGSSTLEPNPVHDNHEMMTGKVYLTTRAHIEMCRPFFFGTSFSEQFQKSLVQQGCTRWQHAGVTFERDSGTTSWAKR